MRTFIVDGTIDDRSAHEHLGHSVSQSASQAVSPTTHRHVHIILGTRRETYTILHAPARDERKPTTERTKHPQCKVLRASFLPVRDCYYYYDHFCCCGPCSMVPQKNKIQNLQAGGRAGSWFRGLCAPLSHLLGVPRFHQVFLVHGTGLESTNGNDSDAAHQGHHKRERMREGGGGGVVPKMRGETASIFDRQQRAEEEQEDNASCQKVITQGQTGQAIATFIATRTASSPHDLEKRPRNGSTDTVSHRYSSVASSCSVRKYSVGYR